VFNATTRCHVKLSQAKKWIADGSYAWVVQFKTIRSLSLQERVAKRSEIARLQEPLAFAEIPGLIFQPPIQSQATHRTGIHLVRAANQFASSAA